MEKCGKGHEPVIGKDDPCNPPQSSCGRSETAGGSDCPLTHFQQMIPNCLDYARKAHDAGRPIVGIMCEYAPREIIMAAGGVPVCLCGGSAATIPAAEDHLPSSLCPLIKSTYGYCVQKSNPFLEMAALVVAETTCDGKKKMFELMAESHPTYLLELPQKQGDPLAFDHWVAELRRFRANLESRFGVEVSECKLREAIRLMNRERGLRRGLAEIMKTDAPPITGRQLLDLKSSISGICADLAQYEKALAMFSKKPGCPSMAERVRVLLTGVPMPSGSERVLDIIEDHGGLVVCIENCSGIKPIIDDVDADAEDPLVAIARKYFRIPCSVMTRNQDRMDSLLALAREYRVQCIVELVWQSCLTYDIESLQVKRLAEKELQIPYLKIETDYSPSDSARIAVRVEALFETIGGNGRILRR